MGKAKLPGVETEFEQVPLDLAKRIAERETTLSRSGRATCAVCGMPVKLEECKTDEDGEAVHGACYLTKIAAAKTANSRGR